MSRSAAQRVSSAAAQDLTGLVTSWRTWAGSLTSIKKEGAALNLVIKSSQQAACNLGSIPNATKCDRAGDWGELCSLSRPNRMLGFIAFTALLRSLRYVFGWPVSFLPHGGSGLWSEWSHCLMNGTRPSHFSLQRRSSRCPAASLSLICSHVEGSMTASAPSRLPVPQLSKLPAGSLLYSATSAMIPTSSRPTSSTSNSFSRSPVHPRAKPGRWQRPRHGL